MSMIISYNFKGASCQVKPAVASLVQLVTAE